MKNLTLDLSIPCPKLINYFLGAIGFAILGSCSILQQSSQHAFSSGYYHQCSGPEKGQKVYIDVDEAQIRVFPTSEGLLPPQAKYTLPLSDLQSTCPFPMAFGRNSLDIDLTAVLFKYRPAQYDRRAQLTTDFNAAVYAGFRRDNFRLQNRTDPLGRCHTQVINRGFDFGIFGGMGTAQINPFSTRDKVSLEYNGMALQYGVAGFLESNVASFGIAAGSDYLMSLDREYWIYNKQLWVGFMVGIALN